MAAVKTAERYDWCPEGRWLHLIDAENLCGTGDPTEGEMRRVHDAYVDMMRPGPEDHTIVGAGRRSGFVAGAGWPGARLVLGSGPDGADLALLDSLRAPDEVVQRFDGVVVASGDHIFSDLVLDLTDAGGTVVVVWGEGALSRRLVGAARATVPLFAPESARPGPDDHHLMA